VELIIIEQAQSSTSTADDADQLGLQVGLGISSKRAPSPPPSARVIDTIVKEANNSDITSGDEDAANELVAVAVVEPEGASSTSTSITTTNYACIIRTV
jgi:hypothetical protein